jgi:hypothetical protein
MYGGIYLLGKSFKIAGNRIFVWKGIWVPIIKTLVWKPIMPSWSIHNKAIPPRGLPPLSNAIFFDYKMFDTTLLQMSTHRKAGLTSPHNQCICFVYHQPIIQTALCIS